MYGGSLGHGDGERPCGDVVVGLHGEKIFVFVVGVPAGGQDGGGVVCDGG